jgi:hypothetical protein
VTLKDEGRSLALVGTPLTRFGLEEAARRADLIPAAWRRALFTLIARALAMFAEARRSSLRASTTNAPRAIVDRA